MPRLTKLMIIVSGIHKNHHFSYNPHEILRGIVNENTHQISIRFTFHILDSINLKLVIYNLYKLLQLNYYRFSCMVAHCNYSYTLEQEAKTDHLSNIYYGICVQTDTTFQGPEKTPHFKGQKTSSETDQCP